VSERPEEPNARAILIYVVRMSLPGLSKEIGLLSAFMIENRSNEVSLNFRLLERRAA
jgi:hypothetical protein